MELFKLGDWCLRVNLPYIVVEIQDVVGLTVDIRSSTIIEPSQRYIIPFDDIPAILDDKLRDLTSSRYFSSDFFKDKITIYNTVIMWGESLGRAYLLFGNKEWGSPDSVGFGIDNDMYSYLWEYPHLWRIPIVDINALIRKRGMPIAPQ